MIAIGVSATPIFVRLTRAQVLNVKVEDYIEAARAVGNSPLRIALRHVLPNITAPVMVQATLAIASPSSRRPVCPSSAWASNRRTELGHNAEHGQDFIDNAPWMAIWPGVSIFLLVLSFNLLGDGLRDALDPRQR